ncbi:hypothetical protein [Proteiniphilum sp. X52]|uniref:hypothetical protein n=1 Tax=Proteiniphilum sp. X52 TaxID=2382159 RepID=UPI0011CDB36F|nr:hypothetical protein [Proteiniphilum sp. X52]
MIDLKSGNMFEAIYEPNFLFQNHPFLQFELQHSVPLPRDSISISFDFKSRRLDSLALKLYLYGESERFIDSLVFSLQPDGHNLLQFNNTDAEWMEITLDNIYFMGKDYKHKQVIIIGKGDEVLTLYGYYTDQGFSNQEKYRKDIESVLKFH